jgi:diacylglycerol kinase family enzyme
LHFLAWLGVRGPVRRIVIATLEALLRVRRPLEGVRSLHVSRLDVHSERRLDVALDGEVCAKLPATFAVAGEALRVVTPRSSWTSTTPSPNGV